MPDTEIGFMSIRQAAMVERFTAHGHDANALCPAGVSALPEYLDNAWGSVVHIAGNAMQ